METKEKTETIGKLLANTHKEHQQQEKIEASELAHEGGKSYMRELINMVETHRTKIEEYYIQVIPQKTPWFGNRAIYFRFFARKTKPLMEDAMDVWYVNNKKEELKLLWSLPHHSLFEDFLSREDELDPQLIYWIKTYTKAQKKSN
jgi:hypothetical protein